jgi:hypothetical protein
MAEQPEQPDDGAFALLFGELEHGTCPGSKLLVDGQVIWLHTTEDVKNWLRGCYDQWFGEEESL